LKESSFSFGKRFLVSASTLMFGTILAQAITFGFSFFLTRAYLPEEFGHYSIFLGFAGLMGAASTLALDRVVLLAPNDTEASLAANTALLLAGLAAAAVCVVGLILALTGATTYLPLNALDLAILLPLFMIGYAGTQVAVFLCLRQNNIRRLAIMKVAQSLTSGSSQIVLSGMKAVPGLIVGVILGWMLFFAANFRALGLWPHGFKRMRMRTAKVVLKRYARYPRYVMPNEVLDNLSNQVPLFLIGSLLPLSVAGQYGLAIFVLSAPAAVLGQATSQAFLQFLGGGHNNALQLRRAVSQIWLYMGIIGVVPFGVVFLFGPEIFSFAFGEAWQDAGRVAQILSPLLLVRFVSSPTSSVYLKLEMQREQWLFCVAAATYRSIAYGLLFVGVSFETCMVVHVIVEILAIGAYNLIALRRMKQAEDRNMTPWAS
jgi:O-antigen/teichoic acid export membrane protein